MTVVSSTSKKHNVHISVSCKMTYFPAFARFQYEVAFTRSLACSQEVQKCLCSRLFMRISVRVYTYGLFVSRECLIHTDVMYLISATVIHLLIKPIAVKDIQHQVC